MRKADLARLLDVSPQQASNYVEGKSNPKIEALIKLGEHFNVALDDLILKDLAGGDAARPYGAGAADKGESPDEQLKMLNRLLALRLERVEQALKEVDPELAKELGIE